MDRAAMRAFKIQLEINVPSSDFSPLIPPPPKPASYNHKAALIPASPPPIIAMSYGDFFDIGYFPTGMNCS